MTDEQAIDNLIAAGRILDAAGQGDLTRGHVSVRMPSDAGLFFMKPHSWGLEEISADNLVVCNLEGDKVRGGRRHSEVYIHSEIYRSRPEVMSVIHSHPTHAVAFSATGRALLPISQPAVVFSDGLPYFTDTIDLIRTQEMGQGVARALGAHWAVLMRNHGVAVAGKSLAECTVRALLLENACQIQLLAQAGAGVGEVFAPEVIARLHHNLTRAEQFQINFDYLRRRSERSA